MKKIISLVLVLAMAVLTLASCAENTQPVVTASTVSIFTEPDYSGIKARTFALEGPTGMGIAKLMDDAATGKAPCVAPAADGVVLMKILDAIYESARTGHEVVIK